MHLCSSLHSVRHIMMTANATAPAAHAVNMNVMLKFWASHDAVLSTKQTPPDSCKLWALAIIGVMTTMGSGSSVTRIRQPMS